MAPTFFIIISPLLLIYYFIGHTLNLFHDFVCRSRLKLCATVFKNTTYPIYTLFPFRGEILLSSSSISKETSLNFELSLLFGFLLLSLSLSLRRTCGFFYFCLGGHVNNKSLIFYLWASILRWGLLSEHITEHVLVASLFHCQLIHLTTVNELFNAFLFEVFYVILNIEKSSYRCWILSSVRNMESGSGFYSDNEFKLDAKWLIDPKQLFVGPKIGEGAHAKVFEGK